MRRRCPAPDGAARCQIPMHSLYADDVILFIKPTAQEATVVKEILTIFGEAASGISLGLSALSLQSSAVRIL